MPARKAAFIGSDEWKKRDVTTDYDPISGIGFVKDKTSGISIRMTDLGAVRDNPFALLAHRVIQLTT